MPTKAQDIHITTSTLVRFLVVLLGIFIAFTVRDILIALLFAVIVASAIEPAVAWLKERRIPRILSVVLIYLGIAAIFFLVVYLIFPLFLEELRGIASTYPAIERGVISGIEQVEKIPFTSLFTDNLGKFINFPSEYLTKLGGGLFDFTSVVFGGLLSFILIIVFSFYLAAQEKGIEDFLRLISPKDYESYLLDLWGRSQKKLGSWFRAQLLLGAVVGVLIFFGLTFLGIENALFFAILAALFEIIPVVGPILAAVPAVAAALLASPLSGVFVLILYVAVQQVESHVIVPVVMRKTVGLNPLVVVLALLIGAKVGGIFGILLAVPITAILAELVTDWDKKKRELITGQGV